MSEQKRILIVGAERGLGLGLADQFLRRGWTVLGTARRKTDSVEALRALGNDEPRRLAIEYIDVTDATAIRAVQNALGDLSFDVIFMNAGIYGPLHQSVLEATTSEIMESFMTNTIGPIRLARSIVHRLKEKGTLCFMSSHRASIAGNIEGGLELYRASKSAQNMLSRGIFAEIGPKGQTVLNIHPGWVLRQWAPSTALSRRRSTSRQSCTELPTSSSAIWDAADNFTSTTETTRSIGKHDLGTGRPVIHF